MKKLDSVDALSKLRKDLERDTFKKDALRLRACCGTACTATGAYKVIDAFEKEASKKGLDVEVVRFQPGGVLCLERNEAGRWAIAWLVVPALLG